MLSKHVTTSKERFERDRIVTKCKNRIKEEFWKFMAEQNLLKSNAKDFTKNIELDRLAQKLNRLLQSPKFKDLNPFLSKRAREIPIPNKEGSEKISQSEGFQNTGNSVTNNGSGGTLGELSGKGHVFDEDSTELGTSKIRHARGFNIGEIEHDETEKREAYVSILEKAVIINIGHPFYKKLQNGPLSEFNKYRVVVEALVRYQTESENWDVETSFNKSRELLHSSWDF